MKQRDIAAAKIDRGVRRNDGQWRRGGDLCWERCRCPLIVGPPNSGKRRGDSRAAGGGARPRSRAGRAHAGRRRPLRARAVRGRRQRRGGARRLDQDLRAACSRTSPKRPAHRCRRCSATSSGCTRFGWRPVGPILGSSPARLPAQGSPGPSRSLLDEAQAACIDPAGLAAGAAAVDPERRLPARGRGPLRGVCRDARRPRLWRRPRGGRPSHRARSRTSPDAWSARPVLRLRLRRPDRRAARAARRAGRGQRGDGRGHLRGPRRARPPGRTSTRSFGSAAASSEAPSSSPTRPTPRARRCSSSSAASCESGADRIEPDDGLARMEAAGERGQAEQIGGEIARLLADGVAPDEIAVVRRVPRPPRPPVRERAGGLRRPGRRGGPRARSPARRSGAG